jgi:hypothetical protein
VWQSNGWDGPDDPAALLGQWQRGHDETDLILTLVDLAAALCDVVEQHAPGEASRVLYEALVQADDEATIQAEDERYEQEEVGRITDAIVEGYIDGPGDAR